jgi:hypothetical protein
MSCGVTSLFSAFCAAASAPPLSLISFVFLFAAAASRLCAMKYDSRKLADCTMYFSKLSPQRGGGNFSSDIYAAKEEWKNFQRLFATAARALFL